MIDWSYFCCFLSHCAPCAQIRCETALSTWPSGPEPCGLLPHGHLQFCQQLSATPGCDSACTARAQPTELTSPLADSSSRGTPVTLAPVQMFPRHPHSTPHLGTPHGRDWVNYRLLVSEQWEVEDSQNSTTHRILKKKKKKEFKGKLIWVSLRGPRSCFWEAGLHF